MDVLINRLTSLPLDLLAPLLAESEQSGFRFLRRLADEWTRGNNRFDRPGEALFAAWIDGQLGGICGLNIDPHASDDRVGRVRRLYVLAAYRRLGIGRRLVEAVVCAASGRFTSLRLRTETSSAAALYERLGFHRVELPDCTHVRELNDRDSPDTTRHFAQ
jgi:ribosomal protein S18 acetylase RimI-like enzyme